MVHISQSIHLSPMVLNVPICPPVVLAQHKPPRSLSEDEAAGYKERCKKLKKQLRSAELKCEKEPEDEWAAFYG